MRLTKRELGLLPPLVERPAYDIDEQAIGIVHIGIGAFHRAHQAVYTDTAMSEGDRDWAICGVSLRSPNVRDQIGAQDGLYTVTERSGVREATRLIGAVDRVLVATENPAAVIAVLAAGTTRIVTLTITEKGYMRAPDGGLDMGHPLVSADLASERLPVTVYGYLARAMAERRARGGAGLTLVSCDNLPANGHQFARLMGEFLDVVDPSLGRWFEDHCACPSTMVDRIVPATTPAFLDNIEKNIGMRDEGAVLTEPFSQWVIEDRFAGPRPRWEAGGAQFVQEVRPFETAKLRMLNGAHSALAYLGLARGHMHVHEAIADAHIRPLVERLMRQEAAQSLPPVPGFDVSGYAELLLGRFSNAGLPHKLAQIAIDGSQKIPQRWLEVMSYHQRSGRQCSALLEALAAWIRYVCQAEVRIEDPLADRLAGLWKSAGSAGIVDALFGPSGLFAASWIAAEADRDMLQRHVRVN